MKTIIAATVGRLQTHCWQKPKKALARPPTHQKYLPIEDIQNLATLQIGFEYTLWPCRHTSATMQANFVRNKGCRFLASILGALTSTPVGIR